MKFVDLDLLAPAQPDTLVMPEIGYLLLTLAAVAVLLFCWLGFTSLTNLRRDKGDPLHQPR